MIERDYTPDEIEKINKFDSQLEKDATELCELAKSFGEKYQKCIAEVKITTLPNNFALNFTFYNPFVRELALKD